VLTYDESTTSKNLKIVLRSKEHSDPALRPYLNVTYSTGGAAPVLTTIEVSPATANLAVGATQQFTATAKDPAENKIPDVAFDWSSSNETVGTVNETGFFTTLAEGTATVAATAEGVTGTAQVTANVSLCDLTIYNGPIPYPGVAVFVGDRNVIRIYVRNNGPADASEIAIALYASDVSDTVPVSVTTPIASLAGGAQAIVTVTDPTIRHLQGGSVTYTAVLDPENTIAESTKANNVAVGPARDVLYNGYKGKMYWEGGSNVTTVRTYDLRGDIIHSFGNSQYMSGSFGSEGWTNYTVTWTAGDLPLPAGATVHDAWLYVPYCWDNTYSAPDNISIDFNGVRVPYVNWYSDVSNFGAYADHYYGLLTYNVTDLYQTDVNNTVLFARTDTNAKISPAGFTLAVVYEDASATRKQIFVNEEFDLLGASLTDYGTSMSEATAYVPFSGRAIETENVVRADLTTFVPWGSGSEGNLFFNDEQIGTRVWSHGSTQVAVDEREVTTLLSATGNEAAIQSDTTWAGPAMVAAQTFLVVEYGGSGGDAPVAAFTATPLTGLAPLSVTFTDASSNTPTAWSWESRPSGTGDNWTEFSTNRNATYDFAAGAYDIRLTASNAYGNDTVTKTQYISSSAGAKRLATVQNGTVSGDLYVGAYGGLGSGTQYTTNTFNRTFTLPAYTDVQWARLYTVVYAAGTDNRTGTATVRFDGNGDGTYDTLGIETLATAGDNTANVYPVNDHVNRQYSDYLLWYDVTDLVGSQSPKAEVVSTPVASNFDGRIKELVLVVAYNDGDSDVVHYWVNDGHDYQANGAGGVTSTFATGGLTAGWTGATLQNIMLSSKDALYTFNGAAYTGGTPSGYFGTNTWDVTSDLAAGNDSSFTYVPNGGSYKTTLATLAVKYTTSGGDAPDLAVSTLASNNGEVFSAAENIYTAKITNIGTADAGAFAVEFNASSATGTVAVDGLAAGANTTVTWTDETIRNAGDAVTITAVADPDGLIGESNEENNLLSIEKTVVHNGYRGKRWTGGEDIATAKTYDVRGDLLWSAGDGAYLSAGTNWADYTVNWTASDLTVPEGATIAGARLYVPYTYDKGPVFPENVALTFNGAAVEQAAFYEDEKRWGTSYPYGMTVYNVTDAFSPEGNTAVLANTFPGGGNVSVRGMLLAVVYDDGVTAPHTILMNEGFDLLYGGEAQSTTPEQATAYAPFALDPANAAGARLVTVAPGAGPTEGDLLFNDQTWTRVWNYTGTTQIGVDDRDVTAFLAGENLAGFRSDADYMEAAAAFLVVEYAPEPGSLAVTSTPAGAAVFLDGTETGEVTNCLLPNVPAGDHVVTLTLDGYADASAPVTVVSGETAEVTLDLTTLTGSLAVTSTPEGAAILIDGADTGEVTNTTLDEIAVGLHTVTLQKDGYVDLTAEIEITYNETASLHLDLARAIGSIAVTSTPTGAAIFLDGVDTGDVTNATLTAPAGEHTVTVTKPGYADASATVTVEHDKTVPIHFGLVPPTGSLAVTSTPDGARIFLDGLETGEMTNATLVSVPAGGHTVRVERDGYREAEAAVTVTAGGTASCHLDLEKIVVLPVADFSASVTAGTAPLTVLFTDASTGDPTAWAWAFGDGTTSTEQNPIYTYLAAGTYTVSLRVTNEDGSNSTTKPDYIAVTVLQGDQTQEAPLDIPGCNVTTGNDGKAHLEINTTEAGAQVTGNRVTIPQETYTLTIETEGEPGNDNGTVTGTVARIRLDTQPVITELDAIGTVSASVSANLTGIPAEAALTTTVSRDVAPDARSAFQLAASDNGLNLGDVAYTLNIARTNLENTQDIAGATIRMTVSPAWVEAHGGADAIRIIRFAGDTQEVLSTWFVGTDAGGNLVFEADSPNGFSVFGLATVSAVPQPASSRSSGGGSQASVGAAGNLKAGDRVVLALDRTAISAVTFTAKNEVSDVMVTMAKSSLPRDAKAPTGTVYQYIEATLYKAAAEDFSSVQFRFAVPANWLAAQGCTKDEVGLFRLTDDGWREVPVEVLGEENGNAIFAASPEGFSLFAITATGKAPDGEEPTLEPIETETTPPADVTTPPVDTTPTTPQPTPLPVWVAVLALGGSLLLVRRRT
jgi:PGF-pre-PGF domain-containing protein